MQFLNDFAYQYAKLITKADNEYNCIINADIWEPWKKFFEY